jgi:hypothetical protein
MKDNLDEARDIDHDTAVVHEAQRLSLAAQPPKTTARPCAHSSRSGRRSSPGG